MFPSKKALKYEEMKEVPGGILMTFEGNPDVVKVLSVSEKLQNYKVTHLPKSDSINIWFNAKEQNLGIDASDNLKFSYDDGVKKDTVSVFYRYNKKNEMSVTNNSGNLLAPNEDFVLTSNYFVDKIQPEKWTLVSDSISQEFTAKIGEKNPYQIKITSNFKEGKKYSLTVPKGTISSFFESTTISKRFDFETDKSEKYGSLFLTLQNAPSENFWFQLVNENGTVIYSKYGKDPQIIFKSLRPQKYQPRILVDNNGNGIWDAADFKNGIIAEDVFMYEKKVEIRPLWEIRETWDLQATEILPTKTISEEKILSPTKTDSPKKQE